MQGVTLVLYLKDQSGTAHEGVDVTIRHGQKNPDPEQPNPTRAVVILRCTDGESREFLADQVARIEPCTFGDPMSDAPAVVEPGQSETIGHQPEDQPDGGLGDDAATEGTDSPEAPEAPVEGEAESAPPAPGAESPADSALGEAEAPSSEAEKPTE